MIDYNTPDLPHSIAVEQQVLGYLLIEDQAIFVALDKLRPDDFYSTCHRAIYNACIALVAKGMPIHIVSISEELKDAELLDEVGGRDYINCLAVSATVTDSQQMAFYEKLRDLSIRRSLIDLSYRTITDAFCQESSDVLLKTQSALTELTCGPFEQIDQPVSILAERGLAQIKDAFYCQFTASVSSGYRILDDALHGGFKKGSLNIIAARPSMGKTTLVVNFCRNMALSCGLKICFFTIEVNGTDLSEKFIRCITGVATSFDNYISGKEQLAGSTITIYDRPELSLANLKYTLARHKALYGSVDVVIVDYLQLMTTSDNDNRANQVSILTRGLKNIAREFDCPVLCLSQLSRAVESRQDKMPMLSDLRDSGSIEQDADVVIFIYRDDYYDKESCKPGIADIFIAKQRNGKQNVTVEMRFKPAISRFE